MTYAGMDTSAFPGLDKMAWLKANTNLTWTGFYLAPAPSHGDAGWMGQRKALAAQGWGILPIYVGQQVTGPGSHHTSPAQGTADGESCVALMEAAGFPPDTRVALDLENGPPLATGQGGYVRMWAAAVGEAGYEPVVYCSHGLAKDVAQLTIATIWAYCVPTVTPHNVDGTVFPTPDIAGCGYPAAIAWQRDQAALIECDGERLLADLNVAVSADPGQP